MMTDGVKYANAQDQIKVVDLTELIAQDMGL
jgi:hypothetical protein